MGIESLGHNQLLLTGKDASEYTNLSAEGKTHGIGQGFAAFFQKREVSQEEIECFLINSPNIENSTIYKTLCSMRPTEEVKSLVSKLETQNKRLSSDYCRTGLKNFNNTCFINSAIKLACHSLDIQYVERVGHMLELDLEQLMANSSSNQNSEHKERLSSKLALIYAFIELQKRIKHDNFDKIEKKIANFIQYCNVYG